VNNATLNPPSLAETTTKSFIGAADPRALDLPAEFR